MDLGSTSNKIALLSFAFAVGGLFFSSQNKKIHKIAMSANSWGGGLKALADTSDKNAIFVTCSLRYMNSEYIAIHRFK